MKSCRRLRILEFIKTNPGASKAETAKRFKIGTNTVSRYRKMIQAEMKAEKQAKLQKQPQNGTPRGHPVEKIPDLVGAKLEAPGGQCRPVVPGVITVSNRYQKYICLESCFLFSSIHERGRCYYFKLGTELPSSYFAEYQEKIATQMDYEYSAEFLLSGIGHSRATQRVKVKF